MIPLMNTLAVGVQALLQCRNDLGARTNIPVNHPCTQSTSSSKTPKRSKVQNMKPVRVSRGILLIAFVRRPAKCVASVQRPGVDENLSPSVVFKAMKTGLMSPFIVALLRLYIPGSSQSRALQWRVTIRELQSPISRFSLFALW